MLLKKLQEQLQTLYDVSVPERIEDFLVTDPAYLPPGTDPTIEEYVLVQSQGDAAAISVYLNADLLERLALTDPGIRLGQDNIADYWTALEGVSHFLYLVFNASHDRAVSLLELELQAEVDKYVITHWLLWKQTGRICREVFPLLFERTKLSDNLTSQQYEMYRLANEKAATFCRPLRSLMAPQFGFSPQLLSLLRRFYRQQSGAKQTGSLIRHRLR